MAKCGRCGFVVRKAREGAIFDGWSYLLVESGNDVDLCEACTTRALSPVEGVGEGTTDD